MASDPSHLEDLKTVNKIAGILNQAVDSQTALEASLQLLISLMDLETGWIFLYDPADNTRWAGRGFTLAAHHQLPPALGVERIEAWDKGCNCQTECKKGRLLEAVNELSCSRLVESNGDRQGLAVHASVPLQSGNQVLGILNVAAEDFAEFDDRSLTLLATIGNQIGVALERAFLHDLLREQRIREQATLLDLSRKLLSRSSTSGLKSFIVEEVRRLLDVQACALFLPNLTGSLAVQAAAGWQGDTPASFFELPIDDKSEIGAVFYHQKQVMALINEENDAFLYLGPWANEEKNLALAAVPLVVDERAIGVLVIHSPANRHFSEDDMRILALMANQAAISLESARHRQEEEERREINRDLTVSQEIQRSMLPESCPVVEGWQFALKYQAARQVGGDFYDLFPLDQSGKLGIVIADVSGKGIPAALFMASSRSLIRNEANSAHQPAEMLQNINRFLIEGVQVEMFLTAFYGSLDTQNGRLNYCNAGHNFPIIFRGDLNACEELSDHGSVIGIFDNLQLEQYEAMLLPGDALILYTDGITDAINDELLEFGAKNLVDVIEKISRQDPGFPAERMAESIWQAVKDHTGGMAQFDDMALIVIKRIGESTIG